MVMARCELLNILNYCNEIFYSPWLSLGPDHPQSQQYGRGPILEPAAVILHQKFRWNKQKWWQWQNDKIDDGSVSPGQEGQHYQGSHRRADTWTQEVQLWAFYISWYKHWCSYVLSSNLDAAKKYVNNHLYWIETRTMSRSRSLPGPDIWRSQLKQNYHQDICKQFLKGGREENLLQRILPAWRSRHGCTPEQDQVEQEHQ